jgi:hypothetical protein
MHLAHRWPGAAPGTSRRRQPLLSGLRDELHDGGLVIQAVKFHLSVQRFPAPDYEVDPHDLLALLHASVLSCTPLSTGLPSRATPG